MSGVRADNRRNGHPAPRSAVAASAPAIAAALKAAVQHHRAGRLNDAEAAYQSVLNADPRNASALHYLGVIASQRGQFDRSVELISRAIKLQPSLVGPHVNLANVLRSMGRNKAAEKQCRRALKLDPNNAEAHVSLGLVLRQMGNNRDAVAALRRAVALAPGDANTHYNLANALKDDGQLEKAEAEYLAAASLRPDFVYALNNLAVVETELEKYEAAEGHYRKSLAIEPKFAETHYNLGNLLKTMDRLDEACASFEQAIALNPRHYMAYNNLGFCLKERKLYEKSDAAFHRAIEIEPEFYDSHMNLADSLFERNRGSEAVELYESVISSHPDDQDARYRLANALQQTGHTDEAEAVCSGILEKDPQARRAHAMLLEMHRGEPDHGSAKVIRQVLEDPDTDDNTKIRCGFSLGEYCDSIGEHAEAFRHLSEANALKRGTFQYDIREAVDSVAAIREVFTAERLAAADGGWPDPTPIFIIGTTRSGSSLVEQILDCHSQISGAGEVPVATELQRREALRLGANFPYFLDQWGDEDRGNYGRAYVEQIRAYGNDTPRVVDKVLNNYVRVGLLKMCLPNASFINMRRSPLDVGLSIFMSNFTSLHRYAYSLDEIGTHIRLYDEVIRHWHDVLPGVVLDVSYEALVAEPEEQVRRILGHCGLDFEAGCLEFHRSERVVRTKSALQVRQPLNTRGIGRWRNYEAELEPLRRAIGEDLLARAAA